VALRLLGVRKSSFLKKAEPALREAKKPYVFSDILRIDPRQQTKVFWFFFSKKNILSS
jgi:hypothetical protein